MIHYALYFDNVYNFYRGIWYGVEYTVDSDLKRFNEHFMWLILVGTDKWWQRIENIDFATHLGAVVLEQWLSK